MNTSKQLRPGRQRLSRDEVHEHQRERIFGALEAEMSAKGYIATSVADVIKSAGVSRQTFYELFSSKQDCFLANFGRRQDAVIRLIMGTSATDSPMERFGALLQTYLAVMAKNPAIGRLHLIGVYAAGPEAVGRRLEMQQQFVDGVAEIFDAHTERDRFVCQTLVAAISTLVTNALLEDDPKAVLDLHQPLVDVARQLMAVE